MLKKVMAMVASKYMAIKVRMRAIETHLMIQSLLLRDKKMARHLFQRRKCFKPSAIVEDEDHQPESTEALINNSVASSPVSVVQVAEVIDDTMEMEIEEEDVYADSEHSPFEDNPGAGEVDPVSVIEEMAKNAKEGQGKEFILEDDIDKVADLFIQRFHHQIWLQKQHSESDEGIHA